MEPVSRNTLLSVGLLLILAGVAVFQLESAGGDLGWARTGALFGTSSPVGLPLGEADEAHSRPVSASPAPAGDEGRAVDQSASTAPGGATLRFEMRDPAGDDYGAGKLVYPSHKSFAPYRGLFDLVHFAVWQGTEQLYIDVTPSEIKNDWNAPEGFSHVLIDVYIDTGPGGSTRPARSGPRVRFDPEYAWDVRVKVAPFGESRLYRAEAAGEHRPQAIEDAVRAYLVDGDAGARIRVEVPLRLLPEIGRSWRYYVWVSGFDAFGDDGYRAVTKDGGLWEFGGASADEAPKVIDLLARGFGPRSQVRLLRERTPGAEPVLVPVGPGAPGGLFSQLFPFAMLAVLVVVGLLFVGVFRTHRSGLRR